MDRAIELAREWIHTHPNPSVGSVITDSSGAVVGEGWHRGPGNDHAEVVALRAAGEAARGGTAYVTLEPCSHHGQTPPCVEALISAGVSTVVVGTNDPDPRVSGQGIADLRAAGIEVIVGVGEEAARSVDPAYFHHRETGMPMVTIKWAMTLDGSVSASDGTSQWISGVAAREHAHGLRALVDGVAVGAATLRDDDPLLDVRLEGYDRPQPRPVIIAGHTPLPQDARLWKRDPIVVSTFERQLPGGELVEVPGSDHRPDPIETCRALAGRGLLHILLEGGPSVASAWWHAGVVTDGVVYMAAKVAGGTGRSPMAGVFGTVSDAVDVEFGRVEDVGDDVLVTFRRKS